MRCLAAIAAFLVLTGCASLTQEECLTGDWGGIGQRDGAAGRVADTQFARHVKACADAGITPDRAAWQRGYARGLQNYCTPLSGLNEGVEGRRYRNVCPAATESAFLRGFQIGLDDHKAREDVRRVQLEIARLRARNNEILSLLATDDDPALRSELQSNQSELLRLQLELGFARAEAARARRAVAEFRAG
ncbi:DUF2799 domain-containing protein [Roseinatronobacter sp.]|uniref:DUF2799 domain-containing protein n=1 Tax=Roseinatronobacter sp. TaxID=1945755 RepID=UPI0025EE850F|nr:DUF2799 domain-containing protein [Roseibaca sp.]